MIEGGPNPQLQQRTAVITTDDKAMSSKATRGLMVNTHDRLQSKGARLE